MNVRTYSFYCRLTVSYITPTQAVETTCPVFKSLHGKKPNGTSAVVRGDSSTSGPPAPPPPSASTRHADLRENRGPVSLPSYGRVPEQSRSAFLSSPVSAFAPRHVSESRLCRRVWVFKLSQRAPLGDVCAPGAAGAQRTLLRRERTSTSAPGVVQSAWAAGHQCPLSFASCPPLG